MRCDICGIDYPPEYFLKGESICKECSAKQTKETNKQQDTSREKLSEHFKAEKNHQERETILIPRVEELTKQEQKIVELASRRYQRLSYQKYQLLIWIGGGLFSLGILKSIFYPDIYSRWIYNIGFVILMLGLFRQSMSIIGKLYAKVRRLEQESHKRNTKD